MRASLDEFGEKCLRIKTKEKTIVPFIMNTAQRYLDDILEEELAINGKVRVLVLKGRQQGISTYVAARFYHKSSMWTATNVYILSHEQKATDNLFDMVDRYHDNNPLAPVTGASNAKALTFSRLDSSYTVATAGQKAGGRGRTPHLFHGSEVAFWANAGLHFAASVQGIPDLPGTEVILETTANGPSGEFYERWQDAEAGKGDFRAVFIPWYWQAEYSRVPPEDFKLSTDGDEDQLSEDEYASMFGLTLGQMCWRRAKIAELRSQSLFDQEYPATAQMAFVNSNLKSYIKGISVLRARKREVTGAGPLVMGADPAGPGGDRFSIAGRRGYAVPFLEWRNKVGAAEAYHWCKDVILKERPARFNVDAGGIGSNVLSLLRGDEDIPPGVVRGINFGGRSQAKLANPDKPGPKNRRAEMWKRSKDWLEGEEGVSIPDLDVLQADATGVQLKPNLTNDIQLESKEDMRSRGIRSPDLWDSIALTFASTTHISDYEDAKVEKVYGSEDARKTRPPAFNRSGPHGWMS
jgi:hypothetical protein